MWVGRVVVFDGVEIEEAGIGDSLCEESLVACAFLGVIGEKPGCAEGDYAGRDSLGGGGAVGFEAGS